MFPASNVLAGHPTSHYIGDQVTLASMPASMYANKHVVITGGSEGLGLALAKQLAATHARVTLIARTLSKLQAAEQAVLSSCPDSSNQQQSPVLTYSADVTKYKQVQCVVRPWKAVCS